MPRCGLPRAACRTASTYRATRFAGPDCPAVRPVARSPAPRCGRSRPRPAQFPAAAEARLLGCASPRPTQHDGALFYRYRDMSVVEIRVGMQRGLHALLLGPLDLT